MGTAHRTEWDQGRDRSSVESLNRLHYGSLCGSTPVLVCSTPSRKDGPLTRLETELVGTVSFLSLHPSESVLKLTF